MELSLDFESHAGRPLPPTHRARFRGTEVSLQEEGRGFRMAVTLLGRTLGKESILLAPITHKKTDVLDYCPKSFDEILQVLVLKNRAKPASRARTGCGLNQ